MAVRAKTAAVNMTFDDVAVELLSDPRSRSGTGATEEEIDRASKRLGVQISGGYRKFLRRFGWGGLRSDELLGLSTGVPHHLDLVFITESERTEMYPPLPAYLLPVMNNGAGDHVCLDTRGFAEEPPVVMWWHEDGPDQIPEPTAPDFVTWLAKMLQERAENR